MKSGRFPKTVRQKLETQLPRVTKRIANSCTKLSRVRQLHRQRGSPEAAQADEERQLTRRTEIEMASIKATRQTCGTTQTDWKREIVRSTMCSAK